MRSASHLRSSSPVLYSQVCASIGSTAPQWAGTRRRDLLRRSVQSDERFESVRRARDALLDVSTRIFGRQPARHEAHAGRRRFGKTVDAEGPPVIAAAIPSDEIPAAAVVDERVGLDLAAAVGAIAASVAEAKALRVAAGRGDHRQMLRVDRRARDRERERRRAQRSDAAAQVRRQDLLELDERPHRRFLDAGHRGAGGGAKADGDRNRLLVVEQQRRHRASGAKPVSAGGAGERLHGVAELAQPLDVAPDRPAGHLEPVGQLVARPVAASLEQGEQFQQSARGLAHRNFIVPEIEDRF